MEHITRAERPQREVVSFVRRSARMNPAQQRNWETHRAAFVVDVPRREMSTSVAPGTLLDLSAAFGREAPLMVEIGPGSGHSLVAAGADHPEANVLGFEVFEPSVASTLGKIAASGLRNVRVVIADGAQGVEHLLAPGSVAELRVFFPDPWHKARHHKRRLVSAAFADLVADRLAPDGVWRLATDWQDYADWMRDVLDAHPRFENVDGGWAPRFAGRPVTKYEARGIDQGRIIRDLTYRLLP